MADFNDEAIEIAHEFAVDVNCVVVSNHRFALEGISRAEDEDIRKWQDDLALEGAQVASSLISHMQSGYDELRKAANRLALVGLVTRLQHWIGRFVKRRSLKPDRSCDSMLVGQLEILNKTLGCGPVPILFFEELVNARDSIIHADARAEWMFRGTNRKVADQYRNAWGDVELSEEQLKDAIEKSIRQVSWYDEQLQP